MSDYLRQLVLRHLRPEDSVRPRLAPLFSPSTETGEAWPSAEVEVARAPGAERVSRRPGSPGKALSAPIKDAGIKDAGARAASSVPRAEEGERRVPPERAREARGERGPVVERELAFLAPEPRRTPPAREPGHPPEVEEARSVPGESPAPVAAPRSFPLPPEGQRAPRARWPVVEPPRPSRSDAKPRSGQPPAGAREPEPPVVQVTIGRIEVRAVSSAPEPPRRAPRAAPGLSLDDYLARRDGRE